MYRSWSIFDAWVYNFFCMNIVVNLAVTYYFATVVFPGGKIWVAILICGIFCTIEAVTYAILSHTMPRTGGDYIYQSRVLGGAVGTVLTFTAAVSAGALWIGVTGWTGADLVLGPFLVLIGGYYDIAWMADAGQWIMTVRGVFAIGLVCALVVTVVNAAGMRPYATLQRWFFIVGMICLGVMFAMLLSRSHADFVDGFNRYMRTAFHLSDAYASVIDAARASGYRAASRGSLTATIAIVPLVAFNYVYVAWSVQNGGEIKSPGSFRAQLLAIPGAVAAATVLGASFAALLVDVIGAGFLGSAGYLYMAKPDAYPLPIAPLYGAFLGAVSGNGLLMIVMFIGFNAWFWLWMPNITMGASRVLFAMSFDRVLPQKFGQVNSKTRTPLFSIVVLGLLFVIFVYLYSFAGLLGLTLATIVLNITCFAGTNVAGALMPYLSPELCRDCTAGRLRIFGMPVVTITGLLFAAFSAWVLYKILSDSTYGVNNIRSLLFLGALYVFALGLYLVGRRRRRNQEITIDLVYSEIPLK